MKARTSDGIEWTLRTAFARGEDRSAPLVQTAPSVGFGLLIAMAVLLVLLTPILIPADLGWLPLLAIPLILLALVGYWIRCVVVVARQGETLSRYVTRGVVGAWQLSRELGGEIRRSPDADLH